MIFTNYTPLQMVLTDRIMAGVYDNFFVAVTSIARTEGEILLNKYE